MIFADTNKDALTINPQDIATGPKLGLLGGFEAAYNEAWLYNSQLGAETAMRDAEGENIQRIRKAGGVAPPAMSDGEFQPVTKGGGRVAGTYDTQPYTAYLRAMTAPITSGDDDGRSGFVHDDEVQRVLGDRDSKLVELQKQFPDAGIQTYGDMFSGVKKESDEYRQRAAYHTTFLGGLGSFFGGMAGGVNPRTNPLNFLTLPVGGFGKSILTRIIAQAGGQAAIQAVNEVTGVQENERMLGGQPSDPLSDIVSAGIGGALFQGGGEAVGALARRAMRWFRPGEDVPPPPVEAPPAEKVPAPPRQIQVYKGVDAVLAHTDFAQTRVGVALAKADMDELSARLASWSAGPQDVPPPGAIPTDTAVPFANADKIRAELPPTWRKVADTGADVNDIAANLDPNTFRIYDRLNEERNALMTGLGLGEQKDVAAAVTARQAAAIAEKQAELERAKTPAKMDALQEKLTALEKERDAPVKPGVVAAQERLKVVQAKIEKLYTPMERAYARAQGLWQTYGEQRAAIKDMMATGKSRVPPDLFSADALRNMDTRARPTTINASVEPGPREGITQAIQRVSGQTDTEIDKSVDQFHQAIKAVLAKTEEKAKGGSKDAEPGPDVIEVEGQPPLRLDTVVHVPNEDGTGSRAISVKQLLEETAEDADVVSAVGSCSANPTS